MVKMNRKLKCYYAHTMVSYNSTVEEKDVELLNYLGFDVINPNIQEHRNGLDAYVLKNGKQNVMQYFAEIVKNCDVVAFRSNPDGSILSGIGAELETAFDLNIPIIEMPNFSCRKFMNYPETKKYLTELGHYKI